MATNHIPATREEKRGQNQSATQRPLTFNKRRRLYKRELPKQAADGRMIIKQVQKRVTAIFCSRCQSWKQTSMLLRFILLAMLKPRLPKKPSWCPNMLLWFLDCGFARSDPKQLTDSTVNYRTLGNKYSNVWKVECLVCFPALQLSPLCDPTVPQTLTECNFRAAPWEKRLWIGKHTELTASPRCFRGRLSVRR